jgi:hypothetical protein
MKSGATYSESQKIAVADHHPELWGCYSLATTTTASNVWNSVALGRGYEERTVTLKIDTRVLPRGLKGPRVESTLVES